MEWNDNILTETYKKSIEKDIVGVTKDAAQTKPLQSKYTRDYVNKSGVPNRRFFIWKVGMPCRALYHEDGLEYEATIKAETEHGYIVEYVGYGNEEEVPNNELKITAGKEARDRQLMKSKQREEHQDAEDEDDDDDDEEDFTNRGVYVKQQSKGSYQNPHPRRPNSSYNAPRGEGQSSSYMPPPPPQGMSNMRYTPHPNERMFNNRSYRNPSPNTRYFEPASDFPNQFPSMPYPMPLPMPSNRSGELENVESTMLMNWYMCGYYTGLHQAMKSSNK